MNEIQRLIHEMCPDGVPMVALGEICDITIGEFVHKNLQDDSYPYPVFNGGTSNTGYYKQYNNEPFKVIVSARGANAGFVNKVETKFWAGNSCYSLGVNTKNLINWKYLYFILKNDELRLLESQQKGGGIPSISKKQMEIFQIPLPPLPIQQRIVEILDKFTSLVSSLDSEIALRQKQYEYYRNKLLSFEEGEEGVEWKYIGDIFTFKNGLNKGKDFFGHGGPIINYTDVYHNNGITAPILKGKVELSPLEIGRYLVHRGDVFFTRTSETPEEVGYASVLLEEIENCTFSGFLLRGRPEIDVLIPEYCKYCFSTYEVRKAIVNTCSFTTRATTTGGTLSKIRIPIPPKSLQLSIVRTLDTFESLLTNLKKERELRQKQYEYYREKLLTFA